jgi:hypothetical protein
MMRSFALPTALVLAVWTLAGAAPLERLEYKDGRLTVYAEDTPLADVIDALKRQSGAELHGTAPDRNVTTKLDAVPLREALERLLGAESFVLTYGDKERLKKIELRGGPVEAPQKVEAAPPPPVNVGAHDGKAPAHWQAVLDNITAPVPVTGRLRDKAGTDNAGWDFVLHTASQQDDPGLRADAIRAAVRAVENDPQMREGVTGALLRMDDQQLAEYVRALARSVEDEPVPFVKSVVRYSRDSDVRSRAHELIRQLRAEDRAAKRVAGGAS